MPASTVLSADPPALPERTFLLARYNAVRAQTENLCAPLQPEDYVVQSMPDASPAKWHLAHTSWFWETFLLKPHIPHYSSPHPQYDFLFNSYYNAVGERHCRAQRGQVTRPTVPEIYSYRAHVDEAMRQLIECADAPAWAAIVPVLELGLHHEQQHQELLVTDVKHLFFQNPLAPVYCESSVSLHREAADFQESSFVSISGGLHEIGYAGDGFSFDNEGPRHTVYLAPFEMGTRLVTNRDWRTFMEDGGYHKPELWLSAGWAAVQAEKWNSPGYWWQKRGAEWHEFTLHGMEPVDWDAPVCHVSLFEADAFAAWAGARLPTEAEWEVASQTVPVEGAFVESRQFHPAPARAGGLLQMFGTVWQWTRSQYDPYPGYKAAPGALGEYNGKFMCNQFVLRGGSVATPESHIRRTYRNFFPPDARWQFTGLRLARNG